MSGHIPSFVRKGMTVLYNGKRQKITDYCHTGSPVPNSDEFVLELDGKAYDGSGELTLDVCYPDFEKLKKHHRAQCNGHDRKEIEGESILLRIARDARDKENGIYCSEYEQEDSINDSLVDILLPTVLSVLEKYCAFSKKSGMSSHKLKGILRFILGYGEFGFSEGSFLLLMTKMSQKDRLIMLHNPGYNNMYFWITGHKEKKNPEYNF